MESVSEVKKLEVQQEFDRRAKEVKGIDSVLDATATPEVRFNNIYRDYISKQFVRKHVKPSMHDTILDYGCGVGRLAKLVSTHCKKVVGVDNSSEMIKAAEKENSAKNISYKTIEGSSLNFPCYKFDKIFSCWVFQHINDEDLATLIQSMKSTLKPGGKVFLFEQIGYSKSVNNEIVTQRQISDYKEMFDEAGFSFLYNRGVFRMPSYGLDIWKNVHRNNKLALKLSAMVENMTVNYKKENQVYTTHVIAFGKK